MLVIGAVRLVGSNANSVFSSVARTLQSRIPVRLSCPAESLLQNLGSSNPIKLLTKHFYPLGAIGELAEFRRCQARWLPEGFDLSVDQFPHFISDGTGWGCHRRRPLAKV